MTTATMSSRIAAQGRRVLWHINRSPLAPVVKWGLRAGAGDDIRHRRALAATLPVTPEIERCAAELDRDGVTRLEQVVDRTLLERLGAAGDAKLARVEQAAQAQTATHKAFWTRLLDEDMENGTLPTDNVFVQYALQTPVVAVLSRVFGEVPRLDYVLLTLSRHTGREYDYSQLWHLDHDDVRTVKLFAYLTDVTEVEDGPFTYLDGPVSDRFGFSIRSHRPDTAVLPRIADGDVKQMIAPRLSTFMVETSRCLHMGSRTSPGHQRLLYTATFMTVPRMYPEGPPRFRLLGNESEVTRALLVGST